MSIIVDTSVALKWLVIEENHEKAKALIGEALFAPDLLLAEVSNAIWKKWRTGQMGREQAMLGQSLVTLFVELLPSAPFAEAALEIGIELQHPVYDCFFLAMCESSDRKLITADERLLRRCKGTRFEALLEPLA